jgi:hypothetical protein
MGEMNEEGITQEPSGSLGERQVNEAAFASKTRRQRDRLAHT